MLSKETGNHSRIKHVKTLIQTGNMSYLCSEQRQIQSITRGSAFLVIRFLFNAKLKQSLVSLLWMNRKANQCFCTEHRCHQRYLSLYFIKATRKYFLTWNIHLFCYPQLNEVLVFWGIQRVLNFVPLWKWTWRHNASLQACKRLKPRLV